MLTIDRLHVECRTARDHPSPSAVSARLRHIAERRLPGELTTLLDQHATPGDRRVVLIRHLHVRLSVDATRDEAVLAKAVATAIAAGIESAEHDGEDVISYTDDVEQLTRLLVDLSAGVAWDRWQHRRSFPGLVHLPPTSAIRTLAVDAPQRFLEAAARMTMRLLRAMTSTLDRSDTDRVLLALSSAERLTDADPALVQLACELWLDHPDVGADELLFVLALRGAFEPAPSAGAARGVWFAIRDLSDVEAVVPAALADVDAALIERLREQHRQGPRRTSVAESVADPATRTTRFGALLLLLPYLVEAGAVFACVEQRRRVALALAGPDAAGDPVVAALLGLDQRPSADSPPDAVQAATLRWLVDTNAVGPVQPSVSTARCGGRRVTVVVDAPTGHWLAVASGAGTAAAVRQIESRFGPAERGRDGRLAGELRRLGALESARLDDCMNATNVIRRVANSLPGFATASSAHIWREALDVNAHVTVDDGGWQVRLDRGPLAEVLRICGHGDRVTTVPWLDGSRVRVVITP